MGSCLCPLTGLCLRSIFRTCLPHLLWHQHLASRQSSDRYLAKSLPYLRLALAMAVPLALNLAGWLQAGIQAHTRRNQYIHQGG